MLSLQQAQTGNRIYGGVSQAPNRGQVSAAGAQGYIKRELRNKNRAGVQRRIGGDGKSDNRSSVAAQALLRQRRNKGGFGNGPKGGGQPGKQPYQNEGRPIVGQQGPAPGGGAQQVPTVQITEDGILQLPYNQDFALEQLSAINDANDQLMQMKVEGDAQAQEYGSNKRESQLAYDSLRRQTLNQNAAGGTAFSSRYGTAVANNATGYANQISDLEMQNTNFLNNQGLQRGIIQSSLNQQLAMLAQQYAHDLNDSAGSLGYGRSEGKTAKPKPRRRRNRGKRR